MQRRLQTTIRKHRASGRPASERKWNGAAQNAWVIELSNMVTLSAMTMPSASLLGPRVALHNQSSVTPNEHNACNDIANGHINMLMNV